MSTPATLSDLRALAPQLLADQSDVRRHMAGAYIAKCLRAVDAHDYRGARLDLVEAAHRLPELAAALGAIDAAERGATTSPAKRAASRANGAKGGRPRSDLSLAVDDAITYLDRAWPDRAAWPARLRALTARGISLGERAARVADAIAELDAWGTDAGRALGDALAREPED